MYNWSRTPMRGGYWKVTSLPRTPRNNHVYRLRNCHVDSETATKAVVGQLIGPKNPIHASHREKFTKHLQIV